ncbi:MAG TPA: DUF4127 family protein [Negativicutes bacterium]|nr:DUF4127 family protein [Negativicutes bacterium]
MKYFICVVCLLLIVGGPVAQAASVGYVPMDDRPVNLEYVLDTVRAAGTRIATPAQTDIAGREHSGNVQRLWEWAFEQAPMSDALVLSSDSLVYGGLVASRTHFTSEEELQTRVEKFRELKQRYPSLRLYVFGTVMRTPKMSAGSTEPPYYEKVGPSIFRITALEDKRETTGLSVPEVAELTGLVAKVPAENLSDWRARRAKNYRVNELMQQLAREGIFEYFLIGRDDSSPLSASHQESRHLEKTGAGIDASRYLSIPGADNLGMSLVVQSINDTEFRLPFVKVFYAPGVGSATVASYEDHPLFDSIPQHIIVSGGVKVDWTDKPDLILAVNTPVNGITREANQPSNVTQPNSAVREFVSRVNTEVNAERRVAVGDVAFGNGSDNSLMAEMKQQGLLDKLASYSGWNTAGNTLGYAVGQGMLAAYTKDDLRKKLLAIRYLDDWAYQANIRGQLYEEVVYPAGNNGQWLNALKPKVTKAATSKIRQFAAEHLWPIPSENIWVEFPWNRMFELGVHIQ